MYNGHKHLGLDFGFLFIDCFQEAYFPFEDLQRDLFRDRKSSFRELTAASLHVSNRASCRFQWQGLLHSSATRQQCDCRGSLKVPLTTHFLL